MTTDEQVPDSPNRVGNDDASQWVNSGTAPPVAERVAPAGYVELVRPNTDGEIVVIRPDTGDELVVSQASDAALAEWKAAADLLRQRLAASERQVDAELSRRMDRRGRWTIHAGGRKLVGSSPADKISYENVPRLREHLLGFVDRGVLDREAVEAAVPIVPESVKAMHGPLSQLAKLGGEVAAVIAQHRKSEPKGHRQVKAG